MGRKQIGNRTRSLLETGQCDMWPKSTSHLPESAGCQPLNERIMQVSQFFHRLNPGPEIPWVIWLAKAIDATDSQIKRFDRQVPGCITNAGKLLRLHTAEKHQGQVQLIRPLPARSGQRALNQQQLLFDRFRNFQPEEQAKRFCPIQHAPRIAAETGAGNTVQSCRTRHARSSPTPDCLSAHRRFPAPTPARSPV